MIVGITGHQKIGTPEQVAWVRNTFDELLKRHHVRGGLSSLALGADQLFAEAVLAAQQTFEAVVPCANYEATFADESARRRYRELLARASCAHQLPYAAPSEEAFLAAGRWIVANCELLFAVWDGFPARGRGGTADVVHAARASGRGWIHINPGPKAVTEHVTGGA